MNSGSIGNAGQRKIPQAKVRLLYFIWKNVGNINKYVHSLIENELLSESDHKLTKKGREQIAYLIFSKLLLYLTPVLFVLPVSWGIVEMTTGIIIQPISFIEFGIMAIGMYIFFAILHRKAENHYWRTSA